MLPWVSSTFDHLLGPVHTHPRISETEMILFCISAFHSHTNREQKCGFFKNSPHSGDFWKCQLLVYVWKDENGGFWIRWCHTSLLLALRMLFKGCCFISVLSVVIRTGENNANTLHVDVYSFENEEENLCFQKYLDCVDRTLNSYFSLPLHIPDFGRSMCA